MTQPVDFSKRNFLRVGGGAVVGGLALGAVACPFDGVTKDKAVRYADIAINYLKDIRVLVEQLGGAVAAGFVDKAIPALEKLRDALAKSDFPSTGDLFTNVTSALSQLATALLQLPESAKRDTIIGILTLVNITMRTVSLFVNTNAPSTAAVPKSVKAAGEASALMKAFESTRF